MPRGQQGGRQPSADETQAMPRGQRAPGSQPAYAQSQQGGEFDQGYGPDRTQELPAARPGPPREQAPPPQYGGGGPRGPREPRPPRPRRRRRWTKWLAVFLVIVLIWVALLVWAGMSAWGKVEKVDAEPAGNRPAEGKGTNVLLVGSDSREGLSSEERKNLGTGSAAGRRTDSIMVLHLPESGDPTLVSLPRDSLVQIPGRGQGMINSAYAHGGPKLLTQTVEQATGLRIQRYMEIGFGGFASVVDSVGGVRMCLDKAIKDDKAHIDLKQGCQELDGKNALGYVRARYFDPRGDLGRAERQREFLGALTNKMASPSNALNPFKLRNIGASGAQGVAVDEGMSPWGAFKTLWGLRKISNGTGQSVQVPIDQARSGNRLVWDAQGSKALFNALNNDESPNVKP